MRILVYVLPILMLGAEGSVLADQVSQAESAPSKQVWSVFSPKCKSSSGDFLDLLADCGIQIRKSFSGTVSEQGSPAALSFADSSLSGKFYSVDLAVKITSLEPTLKKGQLLLFPVAEWHRSTAEKEEKNKISGGLNAEYFLDIPFFLFKGKVVRDSLKDQTSAQASLLASLFDVNSPYGPGAPIRAKSGSLYARYYPYIGVEYFDNLPFMRGQEVLAPAVNAWFATGRLSVEWYPLNASTGPGQFQLLGVYTYRQKLSGPLSDGHYGLLNLSAIYYFDPKKRLALGIDFDHGDDPDANFLTIRRTAVSLRLKL